MAEDPRTYQPSTVNSNRSAMQGNGFGQSDMDKQQQPTRDEHATSPQRTDSFDNDPAGTGDDRGQGSSDMGAGAVSQGGANASGAAMEDRSFGGSEEGSESQGTDGEPQGGLQGSDDRNAAGIGEVGDLGEGTPANVDIHNLGQGDKPEQDWGEPAAPDAVYSSTNSNRGGRTELERGQGAKTRAFNKDQFSRRT
ncbi:hypothetical protein [Phenylobacterium sp.]|jgi:hypothetical protein|uniref:hypothetical protein n=1 Tax=Phenylobacterium sp. TaxID=1871053 RepID=UPI002F95B8DD